ncbi:MAG TPA: hypothetical protein VF557_04190 [Jatrophihabitans sp.]|uniref:hypothetical protein n=1 Tax=Jatrophihabitans sp. TaxID=1932789 RepID=UPI002F1C29C6
MSTTFEVTDTSTPSGSARLRRRRTVIAAVAVFMLVALAAIITWHHLDGKYGPIRSGPFGGIYSAQNLVMEPDASSPRLTGGPDATAQLLASLDNAGSHSVKVTSIDTDDVVTKVRWSELHTVPGGPVSGSSAPWRDFPAVIPAHTTIRLLITIQRPTYCQENKYQLGAVFYSGSYRVHWKSLLGSHITTIGDQIADIRLC